MAIEPAAPRAYHVDVTRTPMGPNGRTIRFGLRRIQHPDDPEITSRPGVTRDVMSVDVSASQSAARHWNTWNPDQPFSVEDKIGTRNPRYLAAKESRRSKRIVVSASNDLMVVNKQGRMRSEDGFSVIDLPHHFVAVPCPWGQNNRDMLTALSSAVLGSFIRFPSLRVLYVVINDFDDANSPCRATANQDVSARESAMSWYQENLQKPEEQGGIHEEFLLKNGAYCEIHPQDFPDSVEMCELLVDLRKSLRWAEHRGEAREDVSLRLMKWRDA